MVIKGCEVSSAILCRVGETGSGGVEGVEVDGAAGEPEAGVDAEGEAGVEADDAGGPKPNSCSMAAISCASVCCVPAGAREMVEPLPPAYPYGLFAELASRYASAS